VKSLIRLFVPQQISEKAYGWPEKVNTDVTPSSSQNGAHTSGYGKEIWRMRPTI
jgi:hypothetical protein